MTTPKTTGALHAFLSANGKTGGQAKSERKKQAVIANLAKANAKRGGKSGQTPVQP